VPVGMRAAGVGRDTAGARQAQHQVTACGGAKVEGGDVGNGAGGDAAFAHPTQPPAVGCVVVCVLVVAKEGVTAHLGARVFPPVAGVRAMASTRVTQPSIVADLVGDDLPACKPLAAILRKAARHPR